MKVLLLNTSESYGGAAVAANRLKKTLLRNGVKVSYMVLHKSSTDLHTIRSASSFLSKVNFVLERGKIWFNNFFSRTNLFSISLANTGIDLTKTKEFQEADVIHLHWINQGFISLKGLQKIAESGKPIVWTMHDMWPCTAICHHARTCIKYYTSCSSCPLLRCRSSSLAARVFKKKKSIYQGANITFVACSKWLHVQAEKSALLVNKQVLTVPNPIDTQVFKSGDKKRARTQLGLPLNKKLILFGAVNSLDVRKGFSYFVEAVNEYIKKSDAEDLGLVIFGNGSEQLANHFVLETYVFPYLSDEEKLILLYQSVDLFVTPSLEENLPNVIMEAMACNVPCVGFNVGGIPEMIDHKSNGYVASYKSAKDLAAGICWVKNQEKDLLGSKARAKVVKFYQEDRVARKYIKIYEEKISGDYI